MSDKPEWESQSSANRNANLFCLGKSGGAKIYRADGSVEVLMGIRENDYEPNKVDGHA